MRGDVPRRTGLWAAVGRDRLRVCPLRQHLRHFPGTRVRRDVSQRTGLWAAVGRDRLRVCPLRRHLRHFPGTRVRRDVSQRTSRGAAVGRDRLRVRQPRRHLRHFPGARVRRDVPRRTGLWAAVGRDRLRVCPPRQHVRHFPGAHVRRDMPRSALLPQRAGLRADFRWKLLRVRMQYARVPLRYHVGQRGHRRRPVQRPVRHRRGWRQRLRPLRQQPHPEVHEHRDIHDGGAAKAVATGSSNSPTGSR